MGLALAQDIRRDVAELIRPPKRMSVSESCEKYVKVRSANGSVIPWDANLTPYMIEPMNLLTSREYDAVVFIGPAQSGKTQALVTGFASYIMKCDSSDFMIMQTTKGTARDFDTQVIKRAFRDSPDLKKELAPGSKSDNTYDKVFKSGAILFQRWPSINELSGKPLKYGLITDYDRMTQDVSGEGSPYSLMSKRTAKFLSRGMTLVETSPGFQITDAQWRPRYGHDAPPCAGGLSLFNMGDMRRYYVQCPECGEYFMPPPDERGLSFIHSRDMFGATDTEQPQKVSYVCNANGCLIDLKHKREMNRTGLWVPQDCFIENGKVVGEKRKSRIASFWFPGIFAAYSDCDKMVEKYLASHREYDITGEEQNLKACINVEFGAAFLSRNSISTVSAEEYRNRAEDLQQGVVPKGVRFLIAAVDVQSWGFEVQIVGYGVNYERWVIDRYPIRISKRIERDEPVPCDPAAYLEDWDLITEKVINARYPLADDSGRYMCIMKTANDSGGREGVTERAYDYWRGLRKQQKHKNYMLVKGERPKPEANKATVVKSFPENTSKNKKKANARGEVPLWLLNTTKLKDSLSNDLARNTVGRGYIHFPNFLKASFYEELTVEVRTDQGWEQPPGKHNESFDLFCYADAALKAKMIEAKLFSINWDNPPGWAAEWDSNVLVVDSDREEEKKDTKKPVRQVRPQQQSWVDDKTEGWI